MKTLFAVCCLLSFRKPGSRGLLFYSGGRKHENYSKQKPYIGGNEEDKETVTDQKKQKNQNCNLKRVRESKKQVMITLLMKD